MMRGPGLALLLLVAGCRETPPSEADAQANAANEAVTAPDAPEKAGAATEIPRTFRGAWDRDAAACAAASELRLEVSADRLHFHESVGRVTYVRSERPDEAFVSIAFEGEGERWNRDLLLSLEGDGSLTVTQLDEPPVTRVRCA